VQVHFGTVDLAFVNNTIWIRKTNWFSYLDNVFNKLEGMTSQLKKLP